ncbi:MAG: hypothetical protein HOI53_10050 [Francisellaceae bacterium]|jgi:hypothetical protein|nr:hypothetical protein [Francisellaceae bacterium]MBT6208357.1 hypothetical protein [Francisellaceae bacterium]MBT6538571.1 hypothetical protein [Francisellaceae bacterium]
MNEYKVELNDDERQPCEVWTRVMGYFRPVSGFNKGKHEEHKERKHFIEKRKVVQQSFAESVECA